MVGPLPDFQANFSLFNPVSLDSGSTIILWSVPGQVDKVTTNSSDRWLARGTWRIMRRLCSDGVDSIQWRSSSIDISCQDSEQILLAFSETLDSKVGALAEAGNDNPFIVSDVSSLHNIVGDLGATIKLRRTPVQFAGVAGDL